MAGRQPLNLREFNGPTMTTPPSPGTASNSTDTNQLIAERREKLAAVRTQGVAFPNDFKPRDQAADLQRRYGSLPNEELEPLGVKVAVAGRMMLKRVMGRASFCTLQDASGRIQLRVSKDGVGDAVYDAFKHWDLGDIVGANGSLFRTRTDELTVQVSSLRLLTKSLRPLPDKFHGMTDQEQKYRQRYVDLITDEDARARFLTRGKAIAAMRQFMVEHHFLEVETPMLHAIPGGANAKPFVTHHNALDQQMFLRIAPELYLKRLLVGGFERMFEINRNFRNEGISVRHNPEFTMMEFYAAYWNYLDVMTYTESVVRHTARVATGSAQLSYDGKPVDLEAPFARLSIRDALLTHVPQMSDGRIDNGDFLRDELRRIGKEAPAHWGLSQLQFGVFEELVEAEAVAADVHRRPSGGGVAARARVRHRAGQERTFRALYHRARDGQRLLGAQRRGRPGGAFPLADGQQGRRRRGSHVLRRGLHPRARVRHAAGWRLRYRHRPADHAAHRFAEHPGRDPLSSTASRILSTAHRCLNTGLRLLKNASMPSF